jgi:DNA polymerase III subunit delta'
MINNLDIDKIQKSHIIITKDIDLYTENLLNILPIYSYKIIKNEEENKNNFKIEHSNKVIKEAYIASSDNKYIILSGEKFEIEAQNKLLKILEEPSRNIIFIIITTSKLNLLSTIISRLPSFYIKNSSSKNYIQHNIFQKDLKDIYQFLKENQRISKDEAKTIIELMLHESKNLNIKLKATQLELFSKSIKLLELNSKPINILTTILLSLSSIRKENIKTI